MKTDGERRPSETTWAHEIPGATPVRRILRTAGELPGLIVLALLIAVLIKTLFVQAFFIPSESMEPTLHAGDRVLVSNIPYWFGEPRRGDIVVFEDPNGAPEEDRGVVGGIAHWFSERLGVRSPEDEDFIKRVVGVPGDVVRADHGEVYVNGQELDEPYLAGRRTQDFRRTRVPDGKLFVLGDNRSNSLDSRFGLGFVPIDAVIGQAFMIVWPPLRLNTI